MQENASLAILSTWLLFTYRNQWTDPKTVNNLFLFSRENIFAKWCMKFLMEENVYSSLKINEQATDV